MTIEGIAYLTFSHVSVCPDRFVDDALDGDDPFASLLAIADSREALAEFKRGVVADEQGKWPKESFHPELVKAGFQWQVAKIFDAGHPLFSLKPTWLERDDALERLYDLASLLHVLSGGNFVVLHLITSLWGLDHTLAAMPAPPTAYALRCFWVMILGILAASAAGVPTREALQAAHDRFAGVLDPDTPETHQAWSALADRAINQEEEHNMKLVFVELDLTRRFGRKLLYRTAAASFTDTPTLSTANTVFSA